MPPRLNQGAWSFPFPPADRWRPHSGGVAAEQTVISAIFTVHNVFILLVYTYLVGGRGGVHSERWRGNRRSCQDALACLRPTAADERRAVGAGFARDRW